MDDAATGAHAALPDHVDPAMAVDWDYLHDPRLPDDPYRVYRGWMEQTPRDLVWSTANGGHWIVLRRDAVIEALQTPELFSSVHTAIPPRPGAAKLIPEELDPPEHGKYRQLLNRRLGPRMIQYFDGRTRLLSNRLVDDFHAAGEVDLMRGLTVPLPCGLFLDMIGLPSARMAEFVRWKDALFKGSVEQKITAQAQINAVLEESIERKRGGGSEDLLAYLVNEGRIDDAPVGHADLMGYAFLLFIAGLDTVTSVMTSAFRFLAEHADTRDALVREPARIAGFVEEILRRYSVVNSVRTAVRDFDWRGARVRTGDQFVVGSLFANLDDHEFACPMQVDFERETNRHIGFGAGPHRCVGSHLARTELVATFQEVLPRLSGLRLRDGATLAYESGSLTGLTALPVTWDVRSG